MSVWWGEVRALTVQSMSHLAVSASHNMARRQSNLLQSTNNRQRPRPRTLELAKLKDSQGEFFLLFSNGVRWWWVVGRRYEADTWCMFLLWTILLLAPLCIKISGKVPIRSYWTVACCCCYYICFGTFCLKTHRHSSYRLSLQRISSVGSTINFCFCYFSDIYGTF